MPDETPVRTLQGNAVAAVPPTVVWVRVALNCSQQCSRHAGIAEPAGRDDFRQKRKWQMVRAGVAEQANAVSELKMLQFGVEVPRLLSKQAQQFLEVMSGVNTGLGAFLMRRGNRNVEAATRLMQSKSLPEVFLLQAQWIRDFTDDYMKEAIRLSEVHSRLLGTPWRLKDIDQVFHAAPSDRPVAPFMSYVTHQTARHRTGASQV